MPSAPVAPSTVIVQASTALATVDSEASSLNFLSLTTAHAHSAPFQACGDMLQIVATASEHVHEMTVRITQCTQMILLMNSFQRPVSQFF